MKIPSLTVASLFALSLLAHGKETVEEKDGVVAIEAEGTSSRLGKWKEKTEVGGYTGDGYLEFTGNKPETGKADSPLKFEFRINKGGLYFLHLRCAREAVKIGKEMRKDVANDCFVRVKGDFGAGADPGDKHGKDAPLKMLKEDTKFFGGDDRKFAWASGNRLDPGGHNNKRVAAYNFKAGETYELTVSGRSQLFKLDRILFRHEGVSPKVAESLK